MTAKDFVLYETDTGQILSYGTTDDADNLCGAGRSVMSGVKYAPNEGLCYVLEGKLVSSPLRPSPQHVFDYTTKAWVDPRTLDSLRATAHAAIERWRDAQEKAGLIFSHAGRTWDGGLIVRQRLQPVMALPALPPGFFWTDAINEDVPMDMPALQALGEAHELALVTRGFEIHVRQRELKLALETMTLQELIDFIPDWT